MTTTTFSDINSIKSEEQDCYSALIDKLLVDSLSNKNVCSLGLFDVTLYHTFLFHMVPLAWQSLSVSLLLTETKPSVVCTFNSFAILVHNLFKHVEVGLISNACSPVDTVMCGR